MVEMDKMVSMVHQGLGDPQAGKGKLVKGESLEFKAPLVLRVLEVLSTRGGGRQHAPTLKERNWCMLEGSGAVYMGKRVEDPITSACQMTQTTPPTHLEFRVQALFMGLSLKQISVILILGVLFHLSTTKTSLVLCAPLQSGHKC